MSIGRSSPLTCCDRDCAGANGCRIGGYRCDDCGLWYCSEDMHNDDLCENCYEEIEREKEEEKERNAEIDKYERECITLRDRIALLERALKPILEFDFTTWPVDKDDLEVGYRLFFGYIRKAQRIMKEGDMK